MFSLYGWLAPHLTYLRSALPLLLLLLLLLLLILNQFSEWSQGLRTVMLGSPLVVF